MFTGIIEEIGTIKQLNKGRDSVTLYIEANKILSDIHIGDSISTNGICLTATNIYDDGFTADAMHETLNRTALSELQIGSHVNLERAMPLNGRFGGHIVSGHIDGVGKITGIKRDDIAVWYTINTAPEILKYIVEKGSIAISGVSLTVADVNDNEFKVSIIPHTMANTILPELKIGSLVNLETDIIGKYVEKLMGLNNDNKKSGVTMELLFENGFI